MPTLHREAESIYNLFDLRGVPAAVVLDEKWIVASIKYPQKISDVLELLPTGSLHADVSMSPARA